MLLELLEQLSASEVAEAEERDRTIEYELVTCNLGYKRINR